MKRITLVLLITLGLVVAGSASGLWPVAIQQSVSISAPAVDLDLSDSELATADLAALTAGLTSVEKVEWAYKYTHRAANRQGQLIRLYQAGTVGHMGYEITIPSATVTQIKAEVNALADKMVTAQGYVANLTD